MAEDLNTRYRRVLTKQLAMTVETWRTLQTLGATDATELKLDFSFVASNQKRADALRAVLVDETDYEVSVVKGGHMFSRRYNVVGSTKPTAVSTTILDQWVEWMVTAGLHQDCEFDGWGAQVP